MVGIDMRVESGRCVEEDQTRRLLEKQVDLSRLV